MSEKSKWNPNEFRNHSKSDFSESELNFLESKLDFFEVLIVILESKISEKSKEAEKTWKVHMNLEKVWINFEKSEYTLKSPKIIWMDSELTPNWLQIGIFDAYKS